MSLSALYADKDETFMIQICDDVKFDLLLKFRLLLRLFIFEYNI